MATPVHDPYLKEGQIVGMLVLIGKPKRFKYDHSYDYTWNCRCDCGNTCKRTERTLLDDSHIHSCGCYTKPNLTPKDSNHMAMAGRKRAEKRNKDGCNVDMLFRQNTISTNTSGIQGISWSKAVSKWCVYIGYKCRRAYLGCYEDIEDAKKIREAGLNAVKDGSFESFFFSVRGKDYSEYQLQRKKTKSCDRE